MTNLRLRPFEIGDVVAYTIDPTGVAGTIRAEASAPETANGEHFYVVTSPDQPESLKLPEGQLRLVRSAGEHPPVSNDHVA